MKSCLKCTSKEDYICLKCGGCPECCECGPAVQTDSWVHISTKEGALRRNETIREVRT